MSSKYIRITVALAHILYFPLSFSAPGDIEDAREIYKEAQQLKRQNQFEEASSLFEALAEMEDPEIKTWSDLAADELRYGLLLQEANYWLLKYGRSSHKPDLQDEYRSRAQEKFEQIVDVNGDKPQRVIEAQKQLDQLAVSGGYLEASREANLYASLTPFRHSLRMRYQTRGEWPEKVWVAKELKRSLGMARLPVDKLIIEDYWKQADSFYLILLDQKKSNKVTIKGDQNGVYIEPGSR